jgi:hypothetical protein
LDEHSAEKKSERPPDEVADWGVPILRHHREQNIPNDEKHHQTGDD